MHAGLCFNFMHFCSTASLYRLIGDVHLPTVIVFSVIRILFVWIFFFWVLNFCLFVCFCKSIFTHSFDHFPRDVCTLHDWLELCLSRKTHDQIALKSGMVSELTLCCFGFTALMRSGWFIHMLQYISLSDFLCTHCSGGT